MREAASGRRYGAQVETSDEEARRVELFLVCSSGGHLQQLVLLREAWGDRSRLWITEDAADTRSVLQGEPAIFGDAPSSRSYRNLLKNTVRACRLLIRHRPAAVLTTGAGVALPFMWLGRLAGAEVIYVESVTRIESPSATLRLVRPIANRVYVQWPELAQRVRGARYEGTVFGKR
jgi:UDP-N-acetylglucosamine:LPS N-acetylglucosamine transferase